jgi:hypothetical protein
VGNFQDAKAGSGAKKCRFLIFWAKWVCENPVRRYYRQKIPNLSVLSVGLRCFPPTKMTGDVAYWERK